MTKKLDSLIPEFFELVKSSVDFSKYSTSYKGDGSPVTEVDLLINDLFFNFCKDNELNYPIISEESFDNLSDKGVLESLPAFIIDPVDGTKDLIRGNGEWSISIGFLNSTDIKDPLSRGWIYQPSKDKVFSSLKNSPDLACNEAKDLNVLVSRTEFNDGLFDSLKDSGGFNIIPMGSIALKLGMLSSGECDLVITFRPKSLWDLAAGLVLSSRNYCYSFIGRTDRPITHFHGELTYKSPMLFGNKASENRLESIIKLLST